MGASSISADERVSLVMVKVERAKEHIRNLTLEISEFHRSKPYSIVTQEDPDSGELWVVTTDVRPIPRRIAAIAGDAVFNLRSALDHLYRQLLLVHGKATENIEANFPICGNASKYETILAGMKKRIRPDALKALSALEAYKGGKGHDLWILNRLNNIDKHRLLLTLMSAGGAVRLGNMLCENVVTIGEVFDDDIAALDEFSRNFIIFPAEPYVLKLGEKLMPISDLESQKDPELIVYISINEPDVIKSGLLPDLIQKHADLVGGIVESFRPCLE